MRRTGVLASRRRLMLGMLLSGLGRVYGADGIMYQEDVSNKWKGEIGL